MPPTKTTVEPSTLERVHRAYMVLTDQTKPRGAQTWFAEQCGRELSIVHRYLNGAVTMDQDVAQKLDELEEKAARKLERQADRIRHHKP